MEEIDIKVIVKKILKKWPWFGLSLFFSISIAIYFLATTQKEYLVEASIKLRDDISGRNYPKERFWEGHELLDPNNRLDDEIGILTSYSLIKKALEKLDLQVSYYQFPQKYGVAGKLLAKEIYPAPFKVNMNVKKWQLIHVPVYITFLDKDRYRLSFSVEELPANKYKPQTQEVVPLHYELQVDTILHVSQTFETDYFNFSIDEISDEVLESKMNYSFSITTLNDLTNDYKTILKKSPLAEKSNIIQLSIEGTVPQKHIDFLNTLSQTYIDNDAARTKAKGERTIEFIDFQLQGLADSLRNVENILKDFRSKNHIMDVGAKSAELNEKLNRLEEKQANLNVQNEYYHYILDYLQEHDDVSEIVSPSSVGIQDTHLSKLLMQLTELNAEKIAREYSSSPNSPLISVLNKKIQSTKSALKDNVNSLINSNEMAVRENRRRINNVRARIDLLPQNEMDLKNIERRFAFTDNIYSYLLQKKADAGIAVASNASDIMIVDNPRQIGKGPVAPNTIFVLMVALVAGLVIPIGFIVSQEFFRTKIDSEDQVRSATSLPLVKSIMLVGRREKKKAFFVGGYLSHAFRYVRLHLDFLNEKEGAKTIGLTSSIHGEGKTFCAINLAHSFANTGRKTLLIDADLHNPSLAKHLQVSNDLNGLSDFLVKGVEPVISKTKIENLSLLPAGNSTGNPSDVLANAKLNALVEYLKAKYDVIIMDTPPVGLVVDYLQLSKGIDYSLLVVRQEFTEKADLKSLEEFADKYHLKAGIIYNGGSKVPKKYKNYLKKRK